MRTGSSPDTRGASTVERVTAWSLAVLAVAALVGLAVGPGADLRTQTPAVDIDGQFDADDGSVTLVHAGGDRLTDTATRELAVVVTDTDRNETSRLVWADDETGLPVGEGSEFVVDDPSVDADDDGNYLDGDASVGFYLESGDTVDVVWTGRPLGAPDTRTTTLDTVTLGDGA